MNPRAGDTVTSTKATTSTTTMTSTTTTITTTGERSGCTANVVAAAVRPSAKAGGTPTMRTRKRRQQAEEEPRLQKPQQPPVKSRRRSESRSKSREQTAAKSRLGDFFTSLASRIRGPKSADVTAIGGSLENRRVESDSVLAQSSTKGDSSNEHTLYKHYDHSKRRKIERDVCDKKCESAAASESPKAKDRAIGQAASTSNIKSENQKLPSDGDSLIVKNIEYSAGEKTERVGQAVAKSTSYNVKQTQDSKQSESAGKVCKIVMEKKDPPKKEQKLDSETKERSETAAKESKIAEEERKAPKENEKDSETKEQSDVAARESKIVVEEKDPAKVERKRLSFTITRRSRLNTFIEEKDSPSSSKMSPRTSEVARLRKTIQWLEEGSRQLREELAGVRAELHEERRAAKVARQKYDAALRDAKSSEAARHKGIISNLKARLSESPSRPSIDSASVVASKTDSLKDEKHKREMAALRKRLAEAENTIQKLKANSLDNARSAKKNKEGEISKVDSIEMRKLDIEAQSLRAANKKLEEKLHIAEESARARAAELRMQHENHEAELSALQKALRSDTIKMIDEIQSKNREIEKLEKLVNASAQINEKLRTKEDETMRKLRESERSHQIRLAPRIEEKIHHDDHVVDLCKVECEEERSATELDRLRELAVEQQEVIEVLRQAVKEKERKLEQLSNKRRKEEFYKQWLELEPVAEVDDEDEQQHEEGDSALSSAPSSLSPQPGATRGYGHNGQGSAITREAYESLLLEIEELQAKLLEEQHELSHARSQVRDLEKALLQETRGSQTSRRALGEKLRDAEEREASLIAEITELREQNELLEFRVLELEESPNLRESPDPADSGIVSPEPIHLYKEHQTNKHRDRAVATVIPYTSTYNHPVLPSDPQKAPLSLQESGIFEEEDVEDHEAIEDQVDGHEIELASQSTQTEAPAGELLQEVQRLQELRARIQERAAKVPPVSPITDRRNGEASCEFGFDVTPLRERIRDLEEQLSSYQSERQLSKQREEELLDENYRLTEKTYCLESDLKKLEDKLNEIRLTRDAETMTDEVAMPQVQNDASNPIKDETDNATDEPMDDKDPLMSRCQKLYKAAIRTLDEDGSSGSGERDSYNSESTSKNQPCLNCSELWKDCDTRIHTLARTEFCLRQQIASLEQREGAFFETLRQADATWAKLEADYESKNREMQERLTAQVELNRALFEHLTRLNKSTEALGTVAKESQDEAMEVDDDVGMSKLVDQTKATQTDEVENCKCTRSLPVSRSSSSATGVIVRADSTKVSTISRTSIKMASAGCDEVDTKVSASATIEPPAEVATEAKEELEVETLLDEGTVQNQAQGTEDQEEEAQPIPGQPETLVRVDESSSDKKQIIYFRWR